MLDASISTETQAITFLSNDETFTYERGLLEYILTDLRKGETTQGHQPRGGTISITLANEIPLGAGLGSSAAWGAGLSAALMHSLFYLITGNLFDRAQEKEFVWSYTNWLENKYHGRPSGCDAAIVMHGDCLFYKRATPPGLTQIKPLPECKISSQHMIVVNTNAKKNTKQLVARVNALKEANLADFNEAMNTLGDVTSEIIECLQE